MKISLVILSILLSIAVAEPPVPSNQYLPANSGYSNQDSFSPSSQYGAPSSQYGAPSFNSGAPSSQYGAPSFNSGAPSSQYGAPSFNGGAPSSQYGAPSAFGGRASAPSSSYGAPSSGFGGRSGSFGGRSSGRTSGGFGGSSSGFGGRSSGFGGRSGSRPSSQYGAPNSGLTSAVIRPNSAYNAPSAGGYSQGGPSNQYLPPNGNGAGNGGYNYGRNNGGYDDQSEPANYQFEYMVNDAASGNDFGHQEERQGEQTRGRYYVVLPDGRKQIVDYEADEEGYKPTITYEEGYPASGSRGGYSSGRNGGGYNQNGGYSQNGGYNY